MDSEKKQRIYKTIMLVVITIFVTCLVTAICVYNYLQNNPGVQLTAWSDSNSELMGSIRTIRSIIDKYYLGEVNE